MKIYVVIPHYIVNNEVKALAQDAICSFKSTADCVVVSVDDCSPMDTGFLEPISDVVLYHDENGGFAKTCNTGFKYVLDQKDEDCYIVCANNDITVNPGWFDGLKKALDDHGGAMAGGLGFRDRNYINERKNANYVSIGGRLDDFMFPGGFYMTTKRVLRDVGLYDEAYIHGGIEDIDLFYRIKQSGKRLVITPRVDYWHKEGATRYSEGERGRQSDAIKKNEAYFKQKWGFDPILHLNSRILVDERINF